MSSTGVSFLVRLTKITVAITLLLVVAGILLGLLQPVNSVDSAQATIRATATSSGN